MMRVARTSLFFFSLFISASCHTADVINDDKNPDVSHHQWFCKYKLNASDFTKDINNDFPIIISFQYIYSTRDRKVFNNRNLIAILQTIKKFFKKSNIASFINRLN